MRTFYYEFADGYVCFVCGRMSRSELAWEIHQHGKIITEKVV